MFSDIENLNNLLVKLRRRHQMWINGIDELYGFLLGFSIAKNIDFSPLREFDEYLINLFPKNSNDAQSILKNIATLRMHEVSIFFCYYDEFMKINFETNYYKKFSKKEINRKKLSEEKKYPEKFRVDIPVAMRIVSNEMWGCFSFFEDENNEKYFEIGMQSIDHAIKFADKYMHIK